MKIYHNGKSHRTLKGGIRMPTLADLLRDGQGGAFQKMAQNPEMTVEEAKQAAAQQDPPQEEESQQQCASNTPGDGSYEMS